MKVIEINGLNDRKRVGIFEHVFSNKDREVAGVLIGEHFGDGSLWVADHIPAEEADERAAAVTFTHDSWDRILRIKDTEFADLEIVGWYHSHPGYGLFLSNDDLFLHRNFFPAWWQIAYVVDPINEEGGIFVWNGSEMEMFDRHEATFGPSTLFSATSDAFLVDSVRSRLPASHSQWSIIGFVLAILGALLLFVVVGVMLFGSGGVGDEEQATTVPATDKLEDVPSAATTEAEEAVDQFPSDASGRDDYVPVAPPSPPPFSKGSSSPSGGSSQKSSSGGGVSPSQGG